MKEGVPKKDKPKFTREQASAQVIFENELGRQLALFELAIRGPNSLSEEEKKNLRVDFEEYWKLREKLDLEEKKRYSLSDIAKVLPENFWVQVLQGILRRSSVVDSVMKNIDPKVDEVVDEEFRKRVEKKMKGYDIN